MTNLRSLLLASLPFAGLAAAVAPLAACSVATSPAAADPGRRGGGALDPALGRGVAVDALAGVPDPGGDCRTVALVGTPIAAPHLQAPDLQQTAGPATLIVYGGGAAEAPQAGAVLATIVGATPGGGLLGNHHLQFPAGGLRTRNDEITVAPTADKCIVNASAKIHVVDGTGQLAGFAGEGVATARLDFCGGPGHATIYARVCRAAR